MQTQKTDTNNISIIKGDNNIVVQNSSNVFINSGHYGLRIEKASERYRQEQKNILDFLNVYKCPLRLIGRKKEFDNYLSWLNDNQNISVRLLIGSAGSGKTKFATELLLSCEYLNNWECGFLPNGELKNFLEKSNHETWSWNKPLFIVIDYASAHWEELRLFFRILARLKRTKYEHRIRILLLERNGNLNSGWFYNLFDRSQSGEIVEEIFDGDCIQRFSIMDICDQKEIIKNTVESYWSFASYTNSNRTIQEETICENILNGHKFNTPLEIIMATIVSIEEGNLNANHRTSNELALKIAEYEIARIEKMTKHDYDYNIIILHLSCIVTICQGVGYSELEQVIEAEIKTLKLTPSLSQRKIKEEFIKLYTQGDYDEYNNATSLEPISPDIIGEAFIKIVFKQLWNNDADKITGIFSRAYEYKDSKPFESLVHLIQDFCTEDWLCNQHEDLDDSPILWLNKLIDNSEINIGLLLSIHEAVSDDLLVLNQASLNTAIITLNILIKGLKSTKLNDSQIENSLILYIDSLLNTLSNSGENKSAILALKHISKLSILKRKKADYFIVYHYLTVASIYNDQGYNKKALKIANDAIKIVEQINGMDSVLSLKSALYTLKSEILRYSRIYFQEAQECAKKAIEIYRQIEYNDEIDGLENYASLLVNYSNILAENNYLKESLEKIEEAVSIFRSIVTNAKYNKYKHYFVLAKNIHNESNRHSDLGNKEKACELSEEAVSILSPFYKKNPNVYVEYYAGSKYSLSLRYVELDRFEEAAKIILEVIEIYNSVAKVYPDRFIINLIWSANQYGIILVKQKEFQNAIIIFKNTLNYLKQNRSHIPSYKKEYSEIYNNISECHIYLEDFKEAIKYGKQSCYFGSDLIKKDIFYPTTYAEALDTLGHAYYGDGNFANSEKCFDKAIRIFNKFNDKDRYSTQIKTIQNHLVACQNKNLVLNFDSLNSIHIN
jgi:tetratricopeptide (TPR) repeat protein